MLKKLCSAVTKEYTAKIYYKKLKKKGLWANFWQIIRPLSLHLGNAVITGYELFFQVELEIDKNMSSMSIISNSLNDSLHIRKAVRQLSKILCLNINCIQHFFKQVFSKIIFSCLLMKNLLLAIRIFLLGCFEKHFK